VGANNVYNLTLRVSDGVHVVTKAITVTVTDVSEAPSGVSNVQIDDGSAQRSMVRFILVRFVGIVPIDPGMFQVIGPTGSVALNVMDVTPSGASGTVVKLTFGNPLLCRSLEDGLYTLRVNGSVAANFHRLFGDSDGDRDVDNDDLTRFRKALYSTSRSSKYVFYFDQDCDGDIDGDDMGHFNRRYRTKI
jgi:hypothetical protein